MSGKSRLSASSLARIPARVSAPACFRYSPLLSFLNTRTLFERMQEQVTPVQSCNSQDVGLRVTPDASQMCAVSLDYRRVSTSTGVSMSWNALVVGPCILISQANAYCYNVPSYGYLVVGLGTIPVQRRRRLLSSSFEEEEEVVEWRWNHTASPCRQLAAASQTLTSVLDKEAWNNCIKWRKIGRMALIRLNATEADDSLLLSLEDFVRVVSSSRRDILLLLSTQLPNLAKIISEVPLLFFHFLIFEQFLTMETRQESGMEDLLGKMWRTFSHSALMHVWKKALHMNQTRQIQIPEQQQVYNEFMQAAVVMTDFSGIVSNVSETGNSSETGNMSVNESAGGGRRRLLQQQDSFVRAYSDWVASTRGFSNVQIGKNQLTDSWLEGPLMWPPR